MRLLRFIALLVTLALAYFAQYILDNLSLADFFPAWLLRQFPSLAQYTRWLANDLLLIAAVVAVLAALGFGLLTPPWRGRPIPSPAPSRATSARDSVLLLIAFSAVLLCGLWLWLAGSEPIWLLLIWLLGVAFFLTGAWRQAQRGTDIRSTEAETDEAPRSRWWDALILVLVALLLFGWQLSTTPRQIDPGLAAFSVATLAPSTDGYLFTPGAQGVPHFASLTSLALMQFGQNIWREMRLPGLIAGLITILATWLLACELFMRTPVTGTRGEIVEDNGQWPALLAAALLATMLAVVHFARLPFYLEPVAWGVAALWLLQRGLRRSSALDAGLSGLCCGAAMTTSPVGLVFPTVGVLWWLAVALFNPAWTRVNARLHRFAIWSGGVLIFLWPLAGTWLHQPERLIAYLRTPALLDAITFTPDSVLFGLNLRRTLLAFNYTVDTSTVFAYPDHLLHSLLAPLLLLGLGALLLNVDTWVGWTLLMWLTAGSLLAAAIAPRAPFAPVMLPLLPVAALTTAFTIDRLRVALMESAGSWLEQTTLIVVAGLLLWVALDSWLSYYPFAATGADTESNIARAAHQGESASLLALVNSDRTTQLDWNESRLLLAQSDLPTSQPRTTITVPQWPDDLPAGTWLLFQPADQLLADEAMVRYPDGTLSITRDMAGNPAALIYMLP